ncbi:hypothetical protein OH492_07705 [Vibrio chagasii]|nr:hypothetical protein [Vibrio chagasii]
MCNGVSIATCRDAAQQRRQKRAGDLIPKKQQYFTDWTKRFSKKKRERHAVHANGTLEYAQEELREAKRRKATSCSAKSRLAKRFKSLSPLLLRIIYKTMVRSIKRSNRS